MELPPGGAAMAAGSFRRSIASQVRTAPSRGWRGARVRREPGVPSVPSQRVPPLRGRFTVGATRSRGLGARFLAPPRPASPRGARWGFPPGMG